MMNTTHNTSTIARSESGLAAIVVAMVMGAALVFTAGFANSALLHDAAHDSRHAISFPCH
ncbi:CbtB-domain containing protein [Limibaculum sp. FT325]|uniref:CbtB domain-containing protein n=1 Tax=Thermohalobaculum sediminis TaxID=2939436 RepID=UPI0020BEE6FD|nr:CbtB domain-containing protein [Limibaculum sediminis]MCL5775620.1 CbtB-domain containing protein [Limibaculum sediminis]